MTSLLEHIWQCSRETLLSARDHVFHLKKFPDVTLKVSSKSWTVIICICNLSFNWTNFPFQGQVSLPYPAASNGMVAPLSSSSPGFARSQLSHGVRQVITCPSKKKAISSPNQRPDATEPHADSNRAICGWGEAACLSGLLRDLRYANEVLSNEERKVTLLTQRPERHRTWNEQWRRNWHFISGTHKNCTANYPTPDWNN